MLLLGAGSRALWAALRSAPLLLLLLLLLLLVVAALLLLLLLALLLLALFTAKCILVLLLLALLLLAPGTLMLPPATAHQLFLFLATTLTFQLKLLLLQALMLQPHEVGRLTFVNVADGATQSLVVQNRLRGHWHCIKGHRDCLGPHPCICLDHSPCCFDNHPLFTFLPRL